jgi:hypothetical protein
MVNKSLAKHLGCIESALLLAYLIDKDDYHATRDERVLFEDEYYFFATSESIEEATTLSYRKQKKCLKILQSHGFIDQVLIGVPAKLHFTIRQNKILRNVTSSISETQKLDLAKREDLSRKEDKEKKQKKEEEEDRPSSSLFEVKQAITKHLNKAIKKKEWLDLIDGLDKDVPGIIEEIADAWIGKDRNFNPSSRANQKGIVTFARSWCENIPRTISNQTEGEPIISEKTLGNNPDAVYDVIEKTLRRPIPNTSKDYYRTTVAKLLKEGKIKIDTFSEQYPILIREIPNAKQPQNLFENYERLISYIQ